MGDHLPCEGEQPLWRAVLTAALTTLVTALATALVEETREHIKRRREAKGARPDDAAR